MMSPQIILISLLPGVPFPEFKQQIGFLFDGAQVCLGGPQRGLGRFYLHLLSVLTLHRLLFQGLS